MYLRLLGAPYCRRQYGLYRPISLSLNTGFIALFRYRSIRALSPYFAIAQYGLFFSAPLRIYGVSVATRASGTYLSTPPRHAG